MKVITSSKNFLIKHLVKLNQNASYRKEQNSLLIEGKKLIEEWLKQKKVKNLFVKEGLSSISNLDPIFLKEELCHKISTLKTNDGYFAEIERPTESALKESQRILIIDQLQDPGNLGTLVRSAFAFNFDGLFILENSVDPYSPKVIRSSMGAILHMPIMRGDFFKLKNYITSQNLNVYLADMGGKPIDQLAITEPCAIILGNEGKGSSLKNLSDFQKVAIPIENVDSLNVAIAGSLLMFQIRGAL